MPVQRGTGDRRRDRECLHTFGNIVCVDDGSTDGSAEQIRAAQQVAPGVRLVGTRQPRQGAAIQTGVEYARGAAGARYFVTFDADGQHRVDDVEAMIERLRAEPVDIVIGTRFGGSQTLGSVPASDRVAQHRLSSVRNRRLGLTDAQRITRFNRRLPTTLIC